VKKLNLFLLLLGVFTLYYACKKVESHYAPPARNPDLALFTEAQAYFTTVLHSVPAPVPSSYGNFNPLANLDKTVCWNAAYVQTSSVGKAVIIPISFASNLSGRPSWEANQIAMNSTAKLVLYKDALGRFHSQIISGFPNKTGSSHSLGQFTGIALGQEWSGSFIAGYNFPAKGKVIGLTNPFLFQSKPKTQVTENELVTTVCNYIDWYSCTSAGCSYLSTQFLGCTAEVNDDVYSSSSTLDDDDYGVVSGGYDQGIPGVVDSMYNELRTPCWQAIFTQLDTGGIKSNLANIITNTFGGTDSINLTIREEPTAPGGGDANTSVSNKNANAINVQTTLSQSVLANASKEYIAETIYHEAIHGYLYANTTIVGNLNQHYAMIDSYIDVELANLQALFSGLTTHDGLCMILGGLSEVNQYNSTAFNAVLANYNLTLSDVENTASQYRSGTNGTNCSGGGGQ
jgi:hypothetical protein